MYHAVMDRKTFPNPKLNLPKELRGVTKVEAIHCFEAIENYIDLIGEYVYTDINLNYEASDPARLHAWVQRVVSASVLRSIYIRNSFVDTINSRNYIGMFLPLKAWVETVGFLASILDLLKQNLTAEELGKRLMPLVLGNKWKGSFRSGEIEAINVATLIEKADRYLNKIKVRSSIQGEELNNFFTDFYDLASNPSHPSFEAHETVGLLEDDGVWQCKQPDEVKTAIVEDLPYYGGLLMSPIFIKQICQEIFEIENEHFQKLGSKKYFI